MVQDAHTDARTDARTDAHIEWDVESAKTIEEVRHAVVRITSYESGTSYMYPDYMGTIRTSTGSGFFFADRYAQDTPVIRIMTCWHVVRSASYITAEIETSNMTTVVPLRIFKQCQKFDMAVLDIDRSNEDILRNLEKVREPSRYIELDMCIDRIGIGDSVNPVGYPHGDSKSKVTAGRVSGQQHGMIQIDAPINPGNSGGPLVHGKVPGGEPYRAIAIIASKRIASEGTGYVVPVQRYGCFARAETVPGGTELMPGIPVIRDGLVNTLIPFPVSWGFGSQPIQGYDSTPGVRVTSVDRDSPAFDAGLAVGDVIVSVMVPVWTDGVGTTGPRRYKECTVAPNGTVSYPFVGSNLELDDVLSMYTTPGEAVFYTLPKDGDTGGGGTRKASKSLGIPRRIERRVPIRSRWLGIPQNFDSRPPFFKCDGVCFVQMTERHLASTFDTMSFGTSAKRVDPRIVVVRVDPWSPVFTAWQGQTAVVQSIQAVGPTEYADIPLETADTSTDLSMGTYVDCSSMNLSAFQVALARVVCGRGESDTVVQINMVGGDILRIRYEVEPTQERASYKPKSQQQPPGSRDSALARCNIVPNIVPSHGRGKGTPSGLTRDRVTTTESVPRTVPAERATPTATLHTSASGLLTNAPR